MLNVPKYIRGRTWRQTRRRHVAYRRVVALATLSLVALIFTGCASEERVPVFPVTGKVTFKGQPPVGAQVVLHPVSAANHDGVVPVGRVQADGSFSITTYDSDDGAPAGEYVALIQWYKLSPQGAPGPNVLPGIYSNAKKSPAKVLVASGPVIVPTIAIK